jgi:maleylpyruvate isomerase
MSAGAPADGDGAGSGLAESRQLLRTSTARLLGDTIAVSDDDWRAPSRLPHWSRGHVGTHVARQADALIRLCRWARTGKPEPMYASPQQRDDEIEAGAGRTGLELQVDLDTTSGQLATAFDEVDEAAAWDAPIELRGGLQAVPRLLPVARLTEVVLHHVDLDVGFGMDDVDETTAAWLLEWSAYRLRRRDEFPRLELRSSSDSVITIGSSGPARQVHGSNARLLGWLTGRLPPDAVDGADSLRLPPF